ncbi:TPA: hypothetical protein ACYSHR_004864 [Serratia marcescens]
MSKFMKQLRASAEQLADNKHPESKQLRSLYKPNRKLTNRSAKKVFVQYMGKTIRLPLRADGTVVMPDGSLSHYKTLTPDMTPRR